jgi:hypothetical protein
MGSGYIQMDESTLKVMIQPTNGKSTTGQMWVRHAPERKPPANGVFRSLFA